MTDGRVADQTRYVYVAGPYTGDEEGNVRRALEAATELLHAGLYPYVPHLSHYWEAQHPHHYEVWMELDFGWVRRCDAVLRLPGKSSGADREVALAKQLGLPVFTSVDEVLTRVVLPASLRSPGADHAGEEAVMRAEKIEEAAKVLVEVANDQPMAHVSEWQPVRALRAALDAAPEQGAQDKEDVALTLAGAALAVTIAHADCIAIAERWAGQYPIDVFLTDGTGIEARASHHARRIAGLIAEDIRKLAVENTPAPAPEPNARREGGWKWATQRTCIACNNACVMVREVGAYGDNNFKCIACGKAWWVDGDDG